MTEECAECETQIEIPALIIVGATGPLQETKEFWCDSCYDKWKSQKNHATPEGGSSEASEGSGNGLSEAVNEPES